MNFKPSMMRKFDQSYYYKVFSDTDVEDLSRLITYARGLIIKDSDLANEYETDKSMANSEPYMVANNTELIDNHYSNYDRFIINKNYKELNEYYINLKENYNINYYEARKASNYHILKSLNNTLTPSEEEMFIESYMESLNYFLKVTYTNAFNDQKYERQLFDMYLISNAIQRYINKSFYTFFNVDMYDRRKLKNSFISWGLDYFDDLPLEYQRRILKNMNDIVRNKGTNRVFNFFKDIFNIDSIDINRYYLAKQNNDLVFYKTSIDKELNPKSDLQIRYDIMTDNDPYWRSSKNDILRKKFNVVETKYLSVDAILDIEDNDTKLALLYSLLLQIKEKYDKTDTSFTFMNTEISDNRIDLFDAIITLSVLIFNSIGWSDKVSSKSNIGIGFNFNSETSNKVQDIKNYIYQNKYKLNNYHEIINDVSRINIKNVHQKNLITFDDVVIDYYLSDVIKDQFKYIGEILRGTNGSEELLYMLEEGLVYDGMRYLWTQLTKPERNFTFEKIAHFEHFMSIYNRFLIYQLNHGNISYEELYSFMMNDISIERDIKEYVDTLNNTTITELYNRYIKSKNMKDYKTLIQTIDEYVNELRSNNEYHDWLHIERKPTLKSLINDVINYSKYDIEGDVTLVDFLDIYNYNLEMLDSLQNLIINIPDGNIKHQLILMYNDLFTYKTSVKAIKDHNTFSDYLKSVNPGLYYYTIVESRIYDEDTYNKDKVYKDRIFNLVNSIDSHLNLDNNLFIRNNFVGVIGLIKEYIQLLVRVFRSHTTDMLNNELLFRFNSKYNNRIMITDQIDLGNVEHRLTDSINITDSFNIKPE